MGSPTTPFDPTGSPFPKHPPTQGERDDKEPPNGDDGPLPDSGDDDKS